MNRLKMTSFEKIVSNQVNLFPNVDESMKQRAIKISKKEEILKKSQTKEESLNN